MWGGNQEGGQGQRYCWGNDGPQQSEARPESPGQGSRGRGENAFITQTVLRIYKVPRTEEAN